MISSLIAAIESDQLRLAVIIQLRNSNVGYGYKQLAGFPDGSSAVYEAGSYIDLGKADSEDDLEPRAKEAYYYDSWLNRPELLNIAKTIIGQHLKKVAASHFSCDFGRDYKWVFADGSSIVLDKKVGVFSLQQNDIPTPTPTHTPQKPLLCDVVETAVRELGLNVEGLRSLLAFACISGSAYALRYPSGEVSYTFKDGSNVRIANGEIIYSTGHAV